MKIFLLKNLFKTKKNMEIQSLSICVPGGCPNNCHFCVSKMHREEYKNLIDTKKILKDDFYINEYKKD